MAKVLKLYNTFTKSLDAVRVGQPPRIISTLADPCLSNLTQPVFASMYICGPTVYSDSHLGHALTYTRADIFRRFMKHLFNVRLMTVMNITDVDDKIITGSQRDGVKFSDFSDRHTKSFFEDMTSIRVARADKYIKVSESIPLITSFIGILEKKGHTYQDEHGDIYFDVTSLENYRGRVDPRVKDVTPGKRDQRDFVIWKGTKPGEPVWSYQSPVDGRTISGRPGWHVQCSAIATSAFGRKLDFHFGGKDLIFPHHYNEEACCCAYHSLDTTKSIHVWAKHWLHSGHLIQGGIKMSKSIGNISAIRDFIQYASVNTLRLICVQNHYRSDFELNEEIIKKINSIDHKLKAFIMYLSDHLRHPDYSSSIDMDQECEDDRDNSISGLRAAIDRVYEGIIDGVCNDFDLEPGLQSILNLAKIVYSIDSRNLKFEYVLECLILIRDWTQACGLEYAGIFDESRSHSHEQQLTDVISKFRQEVRLLALGGLKQGTENASHLKELIEKCDNVRKELDDLGFVIRDPTIAKD